MSLRSQRRRETDAPFVLRRPPRARMDVRRWQRPLTALQDWIVAHVQRDGIVSAPCSSRGCSAVVVQEVEVCAAWVPLQPSGAEWSRLWRCEAHRGG